MKTEIRELTTEEIDDVAGGLLWEFCELCFDLMAIDTGATGALGKFAPRLHAKE